MHFTIEQMLTSDFKYVNSQNNNTDKSDIFIVDLFTQDYSS